MKKLEFNRPPDPFGQIDTELSNIDRFLLAHATLKSQNPVEWNTLSGLRSLVGFSGLNYSQSRRNVKSGIIPGYFIGGRYFFLIPQIIDAINRNEALFQANYASYEDPGNEDILAIHWKKFLFPEYVLVKFTYLRWTSYVILPVEYWRRNARIAKVMIRKINKRHKNVPFKVNSL